MVSLNFRNRFLPFLRNNLEDGVLSGDSARPALLATGIEDMEQLFKIWELSDYNGDGMLDKEEFALALYLCERLKDPEDDFELPEQLPPNLVPPAQR